MRKSITLCSSTSPGSSHRHGISRRKKKTQKHGVSPSERVIRNILNYSRALVVYKITPGDPICVLMN